MKFTELEQKRVTPRGLELARIIDILKSRKNAYDGHPGFTARFVAGFQQGLAEARDLVVEWWAHSVQVEGLRVVVFGTAGKGKSTLAHEIASFLDRLGFEVEFRDDEHPVEADRQALRITSIRSKSTPVVVMTAQVAAPAARKGNDG